MIDLNDLYIAYKKTKYELFKDEKSNAVLNLYKYEENIHGNLKSLLVNIEQNNFENINIGKCFEIPKSIKEKSEKQQPDSFHFQSNSVEFLQNSFKQQDCEIETRKIFVSDIEFHLLSTLWIMKIGQYIDEKFTKDIYGSRLQRDKDDEFVQCKDGIIPFNLNSPKIFRSYQSQYQKWRNNSFKTIEDNHKNNSIIVASIDIAKFFHSISLDFFITEDFYTKFDLSDIEGWESTLKPFHEAFMSLLSRWNKDEANEKLGLPIGLGASQVLANAVMKEFDDEVSNDLIPLYYGRYVDDIILVFNKFGNISSSQDITDYLVNNLNSLSYTSDKKEIVYTSSEQKLTLKKEKQKIFYFDKDSNLSVLNAIKKEINSISSEWRFVPDILDEHSSLLSKIIGFSSDGKEFNDAFRKLEKVTLKRLGLALLISHANTLNEYLEPSQWRKKRYQLYNLIENNIFIPESFIENHSFLSKIFKLMITSNDGKKAICFLVSIIKILKILENENTNLSKYREFLAYNLYQSLVLTLDMTTTIEENDIGIILSQITSIFDIKIRNIKKEEIINQNRLMFFKDLTYKSYANEITKYTLDKDSKSLVYKLIEFYNKEENKEWFSNKITLDSLIFQGTKLKNDYWQYEQFVILNSKIQENFRVNNDIFQTDDFFDLSALLFPARAFTALEVSIVIPFKYGVGNQEYIDIINLLRGTKSSTETKENKDNTINISYKKEDINPKIAIANLKLKDEYFTASVSEKPVLTKERYQEVSHIINQAIKKDIDYLVLPELALPRRWAYLFAKKLLNKKISLITGVEYLHDKEETQKLVRNSIMKFLITDDSGFIYQRFFRQDKIEPANEERESLRKKSNIILKADEKYKDKYIYNHGGFRFASLICSEFTDIEQRAKLRGKIDALMIVEWNKDTQYFNALVESASYDLHCYIVQVNNRAYGDSRIRGPYKKEYDRDIVKVKGGLYDHILVGRLEIDKLKAFQANYISPDKDFKPMPTAFPRNGLSDVK